MHENWGNVFYRETKLLAGRYRFIVVGGGGGTNSFWRFSKIANSDYKLRHVRHLLCPHGTIRFPQDGLPGSLISAGSSRICRENLCFIETWQGYLISYMKTKAYI